MPVTQAHRTCDCGERFIAVDACITCGRRASEAHDALVRAARELLERADQIERETAPARSGLKSEARGVATGLAFGWRSAADVIREVMRLIDGCR